MRTCVQCGEGETEIRKRQLICATVDPSTEDGPGEVNAEWPRHRFKPYSEKELAEMKANEDAYIKQMADFVDFCLNGGGQPEASA